MCLSIFFFQKPKQFLLVLKGIRTHLAKYTNFNFDVS